jgi:ankyrin repeat protein
MHYLSIYQSIYLFIYLSIYPSLYPSLYQFILIGNYKGAKSLFKQGVDPNARRIDGRTIDGRTTGGRTTGFTNQSHARYLSIYISIYVSYQSIYLHIISIFTNQNHSSIINTLIRDKQPILGESNLIVSCRFNQIDIVKLLLKAPQIMINAIDSNGMTALTHVAALGNDELIVLLLSHGANRYHRDCLDRSITDVAIINGHTQSAFLIELDPSKLIIHEIVKTAKVTAMEALFKQGVKARCRDERINFARKTLLMVVSASNNHPILKLLLQKYEIIEHVDERDLNGSIYLTHTTLYTY